MPTTIDQAGTSLGSRATDAGTPVAQVTSNPITPHREPLDPSIPQFEPLHQIAFPGTEYIHGFAFSPDGEFIYCLVDGQTVNLWSAATSVWPEILGSLTALVIVVWLFIVLRVRARRQVPGKPYCRRCNYNIESHVISATPDDGAQRVRWRAIAVDTVCPECGVNLTKCPARRGRSMIRRIWMPTAVVAAMVILFTAMHVAQVPRNGRFSDKYTYGFDWVDRLATDQQISGLLKHQTRVSRMVRVETRTGTIGPTLYTRNGFPGKVAPISPDGRHLAYGESGRHIIWADTHTGRVRVRRIHDWSLGQQGEADVVGYGGNKDDVWVYYGVLSDTTGVSQLRRWQPSTDEDELLIEEPAYLRDAGNGNKRHFPRVYRLLHRADGIATMSVPGLTQAFNTNNYKVTVRVPKEAGGEAILSFQINRPRAHSAEPEVTPDGEKLILNTLSGGLLVYSLRTGELLDHLESRTTVGGGNPVVSPDGTRLFFVTFQNGVMIRDLREQRWVASLALRSPFLAVEACGSKDHRWVATAPFKPTGAKGTRGPYTYELFVYDVSKLNQVLSPTSSTSPSTTGTASPNASRSTQQLD